MSLIKCPDCGKDISNTSISCIHCGYSFDNNKLILDKSVAYYSARVNAWVGTRMEKDKTILTLSTAGIGVLVTMLTSFGFKNCLSFLLFIFSFLSFLTTIIILIFVLDLNADYLMNVDDKDKTTKNKYRLILLDKLSFIFFISGICFTIANSFLISFYK